MAGNFTNRGCKLLLGWVFQRGTMPTNFYIALVTSAAAPTVDTNTLGDLTEIAANNGYTSGGLQLTPNSTVFNTLTEDDDNNYATVIFDAEWTASTGNLPASGNGARYAVLLDDNATVGSRQVIAWFDLTADRTVSVGQKLTLDDALLKLAPTA